MFAGTKIPGMGFGEELLRTDFRKSQLLSKTGVRDAPPKTTLLQQDTMRVANTQLGSQESAKLSLDRKVLRFQAFFKEGVHESPQEVDRVRKCIVYYFLEDDTIAVSEPKQDNSGIPGQGALIKRHAIPGPNGETYSYEHFNIGAQLSFYGKTLKLVDCDLFTRKFLTGVGIEVPEPEEFPGDNYTRLRQQVGASMVARKHKQGDNNDFVSAGGGRSTKLTAEQIHGTKQFLLHDKKVLRFFCIWDDRTNLYGDVRLLTLHYFLADDTIEITETNPPNCGRDPFPSFVKRSKVLKQVDGKFSNPSASLSFKKEGGAHLTHEDLRIGAELTIFGRKFLIYDCDEFTQQFLREQYGLTDFTPINISQPGPAKIHVEPPPYNGFGDEEDSLGSWKHLVLKAPKKDVQKYMQHANHQLKFELKMAGGDPTNASRKFVLTYFMADDTLSIFEPAQRNSGITGGRFLQKQKVKKVGPDGMPTGECIQPADLYVGAHVTINTHKFVVMAADERSLELMEHHPHQFPSSNIDAIITKLRAMMLSNSSGLRQAFERADRDGSGALDYGEFAHTVERLQLPLSEQEVMTVMRYFDKNSDGAVSWHEFMSMVMPPELEYQYSSVKDQRWEEIRAIAEQQEHDEIDRLKHSMNDTAYHLNSVTDQAVRSFLDKFNQRRALCLDTFRMIADHSPDGCIGEPEFRKALQARLKFALTETSLRAICYKLFPQNLKRIPLAEFNRILNGTSSMIQLRH
eukprot:NODE_319_length_2416_cov_30.574050_g297_i0.p1 GENE.NODE_319_length_2416_cov_30.574050_g297_i0~~NODE_319_length_2416_cov_30.574050_g297_i0.p1  ORF type:complete len:755 (-),score=240.05 NODE_319_length_2416_cov_30.574050_g297_i0:151-2376(-)